MNTLISLLNRLVLLLCLMAPSVTAEHIYLASAALGTGDGTSAANAKLWTFFNTAANWDTLVNTTNGKIGPGDTVHIVDVITMVGTAAGSTTQFQWLGSGTPGNPITLKFDIGGRLRHITGFPTGLVGAGGFTLHDIVIEGATPTPVKNGTNQIDIEIFDNGTVLGNRVVATRCIYLEVAQNVLVKNMHMAGVYVRTQNHPSDSLPEPGPGQMITIRGLNNIDIDNCKLEHGEGGLTISSAGPLSTGFSVTNCVIYGTSTAIKLGVASGGKTDGTVITGNYIDGFSHWAGINTDLIPNGQFHCDGIQTVDSGGAQRNMIIAYNRIGPDLGLYGSMNAHIYLEDNVIGTKIYNNILSANSTPVRHFDSDPPAGRVPGTANGFITATPNLIAKAAADRATNQVHHNTLLQVGAGQGLSIGSARVSGNIVMNAGSFVAVSDNSEEDPILGTSFICDYNIFLDAVSPTEYIFGITGAIIPGFPIPGSYNSFATWQASTPFDDHSIIADPLVSSPDGALSVGSPAIGFVPTTQPFFSDDINGTPRSAPWDAGAVEFEAGEAPSGIGTMNVINLRVGP